MSPLSPSEAIRLALAQPTPGQAGDVLYTAFGPPSNFDRNDPADVISARVLLPMDRLSFSMPFERFELDGGYGVIEARHGRGSFPPGARGAFQWWIHGARLFRLLETTGSADPRGVAWVRLRDNHRFHP